MRGLVVVAALLIGGCLCFCGTVVFTGAGRETFFPLAVFASPTILIATWIRGEVSFIIAGVATLLAPCYWALLAWIATARFASRRMILMSLLCIQYSATAFMAWQSGIAEVNALLKYNPALLILCFGSYLVTHILLWRSLKSEPLRNRFGITR